MCKINSALGHHGPLKAPHDQTGLHSQVCVCVCVCGVCVCACVRVFASLVAGLKLWTQETYLSLRLSLEQETHYKVSSVFLWILIIHGYPTFKSIYTFYASLFFHSLCLLLLLLPLSHKIISWPSLPRPRAPHGMKLFKCDTVGILNLKNSLKHYTWFLQSYLLFIHFLIDTCKIIHIL